jgi:hypothetical protein
MLTDNSPDAQDQTLQPEVSGRQKRDEDDITQSIESWANRVKSSRQSLLTVQLGQRGKPCLAYTYLERELGCPEACFTRVVISSILFSRK